MSGTGVAYTGEPQYATEHWYEILDGTWHAAKISFTCKGDTTANSYVSIAGRIMLFFWNA